MSEAVHTAATNAAATTAVPAAPVVDEAAALAMLGMGAPPAETKPAPAAAPAKEGAKPEPAPVDPLDPSLFSADKLKTPEDFEKATKRILDELTKVNDLKRKTFRALGEAERREKKIKAREEGVSGREHRVELVERSQAKAIEGITSGDVHRFLQGVGELGRVGDPAGFWRDASLALVKGEALKPKQQAQVDADPELKKRLELVEAGIAERQEREELQQIEQLKTQHYETAKGSADKYPHLAAFCAENPRRAREGIAAVALEELQRVGRPVDIPTIFGIIEESLSARYELSPRADGQTNGEKGTAGPGPGAGRETSKEPPKPETAIAPATVPAALASHPGSANRAETPEEERERQIRELDAMGFFS